MRALLVLGFFCLALAAPRTCGTSRWPADSPAPARERADRVGAPMDAPPGLRAAAPPRPEGGGRAAAGRALLVYAGREDGSAVSGARVAFLETPRAGRFPRPPEVAAARTDGTGAAKLDWRGGETALYAWTADHAGIALLGGIERATRRCSVTLRPAPEFTVVVVDGAGRPVPGAAVTGCSVPGGSDFFSLELSASRAGTPWGPRPLIAVERTTDGRGTCRIPPLPEGDVDVLHGLDVELVDAPRVRREVRVEMPGYRSERRALDAPTVRVRLVDAIDVRALLTDEKGRPIANAAWRSSAKDHGFGRDDGRVLAVVPTAESPITLVFDASGFVAREVSVDRDVAAAAAGGSRFVDLGTVVLRRAEMLTGAVVWPDGSPAAGVLVTAESPDRRSAKGLTNADGRFSLEPPEPGEYRVSAGAARGGMPGSSRGKGRVFEAVAERVAPGTDTRLELRFVPSALVELVGPDPRPRGFHRSSVVVVARSADGRTDNDWLFVDGLLGRRRIVHLYGRPPWTLVVEHAALEPVEIELGSPALGPDDPLPVYEVELRAR